MGSIDKFEDSLREMHELIEKNQKGQVGLILQIYVHAMLDTLVESHSKLDQKIMINTVMSIGNLLILIGFIWASIY